VVIGGGPSGLMAAGQAASMGEATTVLEKMDRPGIKLSITGKGRCNLTNQSSIDEFIEHFGSNGKFLYQSFARFFNDDLINFFEELGVRLKVERGGRVFPSDHSAQKISNILIRWCRESGAEIICNSRVESLIIEGERVRGVEYFSKGFRGSKRIYADRTIIATGGCSYPETGSNGDGYRLASLAGHSIVKIRPALVGINLEGETHLSLQGLSLRNVVVRMISDGRKRAELFGEILFTHFGVSGPVILTMSKNIGREIDEGRDVVLSIDLKPALDQKRLDRRILRDIENNKNKQFRTLLKGLLPSKLIPVCIEQVKIPFDRRANNITSKERKRLLSWLKDFRMRPISPRPVSEAIITSGGVDLKEIDPRTMESRLIRGLYFSGEVMDIDGDTGGYNLQAAFSTGWLAGRLACYSK